MEISLSSVVATPLDDCPQPSEAIKGIDDFVVQFWGVRGSVPTPGQETVRYGGNTSCLEMRVGGKRLIFDGGTGLRMLGDQLVEEIYRPSCDAGAAGVFASVFKSPQGAKVDVLLTQMTCPLLLLWGEADPWMRARERGTQFRQYYPHLTEQYVKAGHCPHDEAPEQVNRILRDWVLAIDSTAQGVL